MTVPAVTVMMVVVVRVVRRLLVGVRPSVWVGVLDTPVAMAIAL